MTDCTQDPPRVRNRFPCDPALRLSLERLLATEHGRGPSGQSFGPEIPTTRFDLQENEPRSQIQ